MSDPNTLRILQIDGGGARGYLSLQFLKLFVNLWGTDPDNLFDEFDVICGTSVGGMIALLLANGGTLDEVEPFFTVTAPYVFSLTSLSPSIRPNLAAKLALIATDTPFYQSSGPTANLYGSGLLYSEIQSRFGLNTLQLLKTGVIIPSYEQDTGRYILFSNLNHGEFIGQNELISNVALATGAAPIYLPSLQMNGHNYLDGGIYQNNPSQFGKTLAHMIKPTANRVCILSIGTGIGEMGFDPGNPDALDERVPNAMASMGTMSFDSIQTLFSLFDIASTGGQESISRSLLLESKYTLNNLFYYRFQPQLDVGLNTELDNTDQEIYTYYNNLATTTFNNDIDEISTFIGHLTL